MLEIDENGLDEMDKRLLETIIYKFSGGPVGVSSLAVKELESALGQINDRDSATWKGIAYDLASAFEAKGETEKALEILETIMSVDINYRDVSGRFDKLSS